MIGIPSIKGDDISVKAKIYPDMDMINEIYKGAVCSDEAIRLTVKDVVEKINDNMPNYKRITAIEIMKEPFEKTTTKKIKRFGANVE